MTAEKGIGGADPDQPLKTVAAEGLRRFAFDQPIVGLAVSGGSDSVAMLHLMADVAQKAGVGVKVATVDHGLRAEATAEAEDVGRKCRALGLPHSVLLWDHGPINGNLMQAAREARYGLLAGWAKQCGISTVMLAHTADDQAETFLMGLSRVSGLDGLSGMRPKFKQDDTVFCRPFLSVTRRTLRDYLSRQGIGWIDDPSNDNLRFTRVKARQVVRALAPMGITVEGLAAVAYNLSMAQGVVRATTARTAAEVVVETAGALVFDRAGLFRDGPEVGRRLLIGMVRWMNGDKHPPREAQVATLSDAITSCIDATLGGVRFKWKGDRCTVTREPRALGHAVALGQVWDNRWMVVGATKGELRAVGANGLAQIPDWRSVGLARGVALATPGVWDGERLISAPLLRFGASCNATITPSFVSFLLSH